MVAAGVAQRLVQRLVGVLQVDVLADEGDVDLVLGTLHALDDLAPSRRSAARARICSLWQTISSSICSCSIIGTL
jgi:hypothetical protein